MGGRTLGDDFDDDGPGELSLETGSALGSGAAVSTYGGGGLDLDDDFDEPLPPNAIELDMPQVSARSLAPTHAVPDLGPLPVRSSGTMAAVRPSMQPAHSSGTMAAVRPNGMQPAQHPSGTFGAVQPPPPVVSSIPAPVLSSAPGPVEIFVPSAPPSSSSVSLPPSPELAAAPTNRPSPAAIVAKYPDVPEKVWHAPAYAWRVFFRQLELRQDLDSLRRRRSPDVPLYEAALKAHDPKAFALGVALTCAGLVIVGFLFFLPVILRFVRAPD